MSFALSVPRVNVLNVKRILLPLILKDCAVSALLHGKRLTMDGRIANVLILLILKTTMPAKPVIKSSLDAVNASMRHRKMSTNLAKK